MSQPTNDMFSMPIGVSAVLDAVNENPSQQRWTSSPKVHADLYIDDSSLGCPIRFVDGVKRPVADWTRIRKQLVKEGFLD